MASFFVPFLAIALLVAGAAAAPGERHYMLSSGCAGSSTTGVRGVRIACASKVYYIEEPANGLRGRPKSGFIGGKAFADLVNSASNTPSVQLAGYRAGGLVPLQLALVALNATWDARSSTLSLATRPQANQPLLTADHSLSSATVYVLPVRQPWFYAAAPADPSKAVNLSDPKASVPPANRIRESAFPTVTSFKRGKGVGEAPALSYTLLHNSTQGSLTVVPGTQGTTWRLRLRAPWSAVWQAHNKPHHGEQPLRGFVATWRGRLRANKTAAVGNVIVQTGATSCAIPHELAGVAAGDDGSVTYTIVLVNRAQAQQCASALSLAGAATAAAGSPGQVMLVATGSTFTKLPCQQLSTACVAPYLAGGFLVLSAYPLPPLPASVSASGITGSNAPLDQYSNNYPVFTPQSMLAAIGTDPQIADQYCEGSMQSSTFMAASDANSNLAANASVGAKFWGVTASLSASYQSVSSSMSSGNSTYTTAGLYCGLFAYTLPANLFGLQLTDSFISSAVKAVSNGYSKAALQQLYETFGSHFISTVVLGGFVGTSMSASATSMSQQESANISVSASISYGLASASGSVNSGSVSGSTAQDYGWSWNAIQSPAGFGAPSLTYVNGLPDMTTYQNALAELGLNQLVPVAYSVSDFASTVFSPINFEQLWSGQNVTVQQITQLGELYNVYVTYCLNSTNCPLNTQGCGNYGYPVNGTNPNNATVTPACLPCLDGILSSSSPYAMNACPFYSAGCSGQPGAAVPFVCEPPLGTLWSLPGPDGDTSSSYNCLSNSGGSPTCLQSASTQYSFCIQFVPDDSDVDIGATTLALFDNWAANPSQAIYSVNSAVNGGVSGMAPSSLCMTGSGNLVSEVDAISAGLWWQTNTGSGQSCQGSGPPYYAMMQDDGNFVVYDGSQLPLWATNTEGGSQSQPAGYVGVC